MEYVKLSDVCDVRDGTHDSPKYVDSGYPLVTSKNIVDGKLDLSVVSYVSKNDYDKINERSKVDPGDIIMPMIGTIGNPYLVDVFSDFAIKNVALIKFPKKDVINKFIWYFLKSYAFRRYVDKNNKGGTQKFLSLNDIRNVLIPQFCFEKQTDIVNHLDKIFLVLRKRKKELVLLDNLIKARFVELFENDCQRMKLSDVCSIITDGTHQPPKFVSDGIPFIFVANIIDNKVTYDAEKFIDQSTYDELIKRTPIEIGDVLLSTVGSYGHPAVVKTDKKFLFQRHIAYLKPKKDIIDSDYLHGAILSPDVQRQIEEGVKGIAQKTLNLTEIKKMTIPVPDINKQKKFASFVAQIDKSKVAVQKSLDETQLLFDKLMQEYFG